MTLDKYSVKAKEIFGTTENPEKGGFILRDGSIIRMPAIIGADTERLRTHEYCIDMVYGKFNDVNDYFKWNAFFATSNAIRYNFRYSGVEIYGKPTLQQYQTLRYIMMEILRKRYRINKKVMVSLFTFEEKTGYVYEPGYVEFGVSDLPAIETIVDGFYSSPIAFHKYGDIRRNPSETGSLDRYSETAKHLYGTTNKWQYAGFILRDGSLLKTRPDSGQMELHAAVANYVLFKLGESSGGYIQDLMIFATNANAIRISPEYCGIQIFRRPTDEQCDTLTWVIRDMLRNARYVTIEFISRGINRNNYCVVDITLNNLANLRGIVDHYAER